MKRSSFDAIIFDHDGTLVDTETPDYLACKMLCDEVGVSLTLEYWAETIVGHMNGYDKFFTEIIGVDHNGATKAEMWDRLRALWRITLENVTLMPGVSQALPHLHEQGYPLAVATASDRKWANRWLGQFKLSDYFQVVATRDDVSNNKPAPDVYLFAAKQLGVQPERCLVFEDSVAGMTAAKAAGMTVVAIPSQVTRVLNFSQADDVIENLELVTSDWIDLLGTRLATRTNLSSSQGFSRGNDAKLF